MEHIGEALDAIGDRATELLDVSWHLLTDAEELAALAHLARLQARLDAVKLRLVRDAGTRAGVNVVGFYADYLGHSTASAQRDLAAAEALDPVDGVLRGFGAAYAAGEVTRAHVDIAVRVPARVPVALRERREEIDGFLTTHARELTPRSLTRVTEELAAVLDPERVEDWSADAHERRGLTTATLIDGSTRIVYEGAGLDAATVQAAIRDASKPDPATQDEQGVLVTDTRTAAQRRADGLAAMARHWLARRAESVAPAEVIVVATAEQAIAAAAGQNGIGSAHEVGTGTAVNGKTLQQLMCEAIIRPARISADGKLLNLGNRVRLATPLQKAALAARDGGCVIPGCTVSPKACHAHHVRWWSRQGPTDIGNLALVCSRHHTEIHQETGWAVEMIDGVPWAIPPARYDPHRTPRRNTLRQALTAARQLATDDAA